MVVGEIGTKGSTFSPEILLFFSSLLCYLEMSDDFPGGLEEP